jgi:hypothetical protein
MQVDFVFASGLCWCDFTVSDGRTFINRARLCRLEQCPLCTRADLVAGGSVYVKFQGNIARLGLNYKFQTSLRFRCAGPGHSRGPRASATELPPVGWVARRAVSKKRNATRFGRAISERGLRNDIIREVLVHGFSGL